MNDDGTSGRGVGQGALVFLVLYGLGWALTFAGLPPEVGLVYLVALVGTGVGLAVAGRSRRARGIGAGMLIGFGVGLLIFGACFAVIVNQLA